MDLRVIGQSYLSSGFLCLVYGRQEHMVLMQHDSPLLFFPREANKGAPETALQLQCRVTVSCVCRSVFLKEKL